MNFIFTVWLFYDLLWNLFLYRCQNFVKIPDMSILHALKMIKQHFSLPLCCCVFWHNIKIVPR